MIAIDTSAIVAIVLGEPELEQLSAVVTRQSCVMAAPNVTEAAMVLEARRGPDSVPDLGLALRQGGIEVLPLDEQLAWGAHTAWQRFGKGRHPAGLDFGDCFAYAVAKSLQVPLLFKGDDFTKTDVASALD